MSGLGIGFGMVAVIALLVALPLLLAGCALISIFSGNRPLEQKLLWTLVVLVAPFLGALLYLLLGRRPMQA